MILQVYKNFVVAVKVNIFYPFKTKDTKKLKVFTSFFLQSLPRLLHFYAKSCCWPCPTHPIFMPSKKGFMQISLL